MPLKAENADIIIVNQVLENVSTRSEFQVRPTIVNNSLEWLQANNALYSHIQICEDNLIDNNVPSIMSNFTEPCYEDTCSPHDCVGYKEICSTAKILRGTLHQSSSLVTDEFTGSNYTETLYLQSGLLNGNNLNVNSCRDAVHSNCYCCYCYFDSTKSVDVVDDSRCLFNMWPFLLPKAKLH